MNKKTQIALQLTFDKPPEEIVKILRNRDIQISSHWTEQLELIEERVFTVAKCASADVLEIIKKNIDTAIEKGLPFDKFKKSVQIQLNTSGFKNTPESKAWRLDNIFRTNLQSAFMEGRWHEQKAVTDTFPFWEFVAVNDNSTTDGCRSLNGTILKSNDPFWNYNYPPRHYRCRSRVRSISKYDIEDKNIMLSPSEQYRNIMPSKGFATNPGEWTPNFKKYSPDIAKELKNNLKKREEEEGEYIMPCEFTNFKNKFFKLTDAMLYMRTLSEFSLLKSCVKQTTDQEDWKSLKLYSASDVPLNLRAVMPTLLPKAEKRTDAYSTLVNALGVEKGVERYIEIKNFGKLLIIPKWIKHITKHNLDNREQYAHLIIPTLVSPSEIWETLYVNSKVANSVTTRFQYIKYYKTDETNSTDNNILIVVNLDIKKNKFLYNMMNKSNFDLDEIRRGKLIHLDESLKELSVGYWE